jgi:hypothetical protein
MGERDGGGPVKLPDRSLRTTRAPLLPIALVALAACGSQPEGSSPKTTDDGGRESGAIDGHAGPSPEAGAPLPDASGVKEAEAAAPLPPDPCVEAGTCPPGTWLNVTPPGVDLVDALDCGNYGAQTVRVDPGAPAEAYAQFMCQGIWKSSDYGMTWKGPINTGTGGASVGDTAGGIAIAPGKAHEPPVLYSVGIRGNGTGFWKSTDGGVSWTNYAVAPGGARQDFYPPAVDPYDGGHLLMAGHEQDLLVESTDGGETWTNVPLAAGMNENGGTGAIFFVDTGLSFSTRVTWLWLAQDSGGLYGTWRTSDGTTWSQVDKNEHPHGSSQIYQPDQSGVVYMAGAYSTLGWGVLRSLDFGSTWTHVGGTSVETVVFGTSKKVYSMFGWAIGEGQTVDPSLEVAPQPGLMAWSPSVTPAGMSQGPAQVAVTSDGVHAIALAACYNAGLWRYVEP